MYYLWELYNSFFKLADFFELLDSRFTMLKKPHQNKVNNIFDSEKMYVGNMNMHKCLNQLG